jgi:hypothetical protein
MRTEQLIAELASCAVPVRPLSSPGVRFAAWCAVAIVSAILGFVIFGPRDGLAGLIGPALLIPAGFAIAIAALAAMASLVLAVPGGERTPALRLLAFALLALWGAIGLVAVVRAGGLVGASHWYICFTRVIAIGILPACLLFVLLQRAWPLRRRSASACCVLAAMAVGSSVMPFVCPINGASHAFLGHFGPALTMTGAGALFSGALLRAAARADRWG